MLEFSNHLVVLISARCLGVLIDAERGPARLPVSPEGQKLGESQKKLDGAVTLGRKYSERKHATQKPNTRTVSCSRKTTILWTEVRDISVNERGLCWYRTNLASADQLWNLRSPARN